MHFCMIEPNNLMIVRLIIVLGKLYYHYIYN